MALSPPPAGRSFAGVVEGGSPIVLARIADPAVGLALWRRADMSGGALESWLDALPADRLPHGRFLVRPWEVVTALATVLPGPGFATDVADLCRRFLAIAGGDWVDVRLEAVAHDACWKFHRDHVRLRLITTYRGPGTQVVAPVDGARALASQRRYRGPLYQLPRHAVALFKGCGETGGCEEGVVHRSPPVAGTGQVRLVLCLNAPSAASPDPWGGGPWGGD
ncbi:DUF1826 domain-containing protein [Azospirillum sp. B4]|uniref:DUF1826 domain-containing protein n=1 Tax=Azospirillum sp. B4 TaxID=95605 RepID=UPI00131EE2D6|nr:DUF1826 domain-containing protein [Azospirillum sp. B4]